MQKIGIDIGSTYTKYCIMSDTNRIIKLYSEPSPIRQKIYFEEKLRGLISEYPDSKIVSCGYGRKNIQSIKIISELTALAMGSNFVFPGINTVLDIGGQDTKIICHNNGKISRFFINNKCAAGSGLFLANTCKLLEMGLDDIDLERGLHSSIDLSSVCAVFAQSEITNLIADNTPPDEIITAVIRHILLQAKNLLPKVICSELLLSGGLTNIKGFEAYASEILERKCVIPNNSSFLSAVGCALTACE